MTIGGVEVVTDTGWEYLKHSSIPSRGINDYVRRIQFVTQPTPDQLKAICRWLENDKCPGWTSVCAQLVFGTNSLPVEYRFTTTYDSSD